MSKEKNEDKISIIHGLYQTDLIQKYGEGASQILQAYKGIRIDSSGNEISHQGRSLKDISNYKVNKENQYGSYKQQSGFSAELVKEARDNKSSILNGNKSRTRTTDGIGNTNDQYHDHIKVDSNGNVIKGSGSQMKIKGKFNTDAEVRQSSENIVKDMVSDKWQKYKDSPMDIASEQVEYAKEFAEKKANDLKEQASNQRIKGNNRKALELEEKAKRYEKAKENIRDSGVSSKEGMEARLNPKTFVAKEILKDSHNAGVEAAKSSFILGGAISGAQNIYSVIFEDKAINDAIEDTVKSTVIATGSSYIVSASGSAIKSIMHSSKNSIVRNLGKTNAPAMIVTGTMEVGKSICKYAKGNINEEELLMELGEKGTGMVAASYGTAIGTAILPGIGSIIGGMVGYTASSMLYNGALSALTDSRISYERRIIIEKLAEQSILQMEMYEDQFKKEAKDVLQHRDEIFNDILTGMRDGILNDNIDDFFTNVNTLGNYFGVELQFKTFDEFDKFMSDDDTIVVL